MAFSFEQPPQQTRFSFNPKLLLGIGGGVVVLVVIGIIVAVVSRSPETVVVDKQEVINEGEQSPGGVTANPSQNTPPAEEVGIQYRSSPPPKLVIGDTHILTAQEKSEYGFPASATVRATVVADANGNPTLKMEYVTAR